MNRGMALVESYMIFQNNDVTEENKKIAIALGWALEMVKNAHFIYVFLISF